MQHTTHMGSRGAARTPPFIFQKGIESQVFQECQDRLCCPVAGALFIQKLNAVAANAGVVKKRALVPDLSVDPASKKRAKSKAKSQPKAKGKPNKQVLAPGETMESMEADVFVRIHARQG